MKYYFQHLIILFLMSCILNGQQGGKSFLVSHLTDRIIENPRRLEYDSLKNEIFDLYEVAPKNSYANEEIGKYYFSKDSLDLAAYYLKKSFKYSLSRYGPALKLSELYFKKGDIDKGYYYLEESLKKGNPYTYVVNQWIWNKNVNFSTNIIEPNRFNKLVNKYLTKKDSLVHNILDKAQKSNDKEKIILYEKAIEIEKTTLFVSEYLQAQLLEEIGDIYWFKQKDYKKALEKYLQAIKYYELCDSRVNLSDLYYEVAYIYGISYENRKEGLIYIKEAIKNSIIIGIDNYKIAGYYSYSGDLYGKLKDYNNALDNYQYSLNLYNILDSDRKDEKIAANEDIITIMIKISACYYGSAKYAKLFEKYEETINYAKEYAHYNVDGLYMMKFTAYENLGIVSEKVEEFYDYFEYKEQQEDNLNNNQYEIIEFINPPSYFNILLTFSNVVLKKYDQKDLWTFYNSKDFKRLKKSYQYAKNNNIIEITINSIESESHILSEILNDWDAYLNELIIIGDICFSKNNDILGKDELIELISKNKSIEFVDIEEIFNKGLVSYFSNELEIVFQKHMEKGSQIAGEKIDATNCIGTLFWTRAHIFGRQKQYQKAVEVVLRSIRIIEEECKDQIELLENYHFLATIYLKLGEIENAEKAYLLCINIIEKIRLEAPEQYKSNFLDIKFGIYNNLLSIYFQQKKYNDFLYVMEATRARTLSDNLSNYKINKDILKNIQGDLNEDELVLYFHEVFFSDDSVFNNTILSEVGTQEYFVGSITKDKFSIKISALDIDTSKIDLLDNDKYKSERLFRYYNSLLRDPSKDGFNYISKILYKKLINIYSKDLVNYSKIIVIPHGELGLIPFETLINAEGQYLGSTHSISYVQSLSVLDKLKNRKHIGARKKLLAFGGADYQKNHTIKDTDEKTDLTLLRSIVPDMIKENQSIKEIYRELDYTALKNLPGSLSEVQQISEMIDNSTIYTSKDVTEDQVKSLSENGELEKYEIIHFATHAKVIPDIPELSAIIFPVNDNQSNEDGFLRIGEIYNLNISADLINLSACETGLGKIYYSEGVVSFTQAFMAAGTNAVSVTLWPIYDKSTSEFMVSMYSKANNGMTYPGAINSTKREFISGEHGELYKHPFFWAPYVYYGK